VHTRKTTSLRLRCEVPGSSEARDVETKDKDGKRVMTRAFDLRHNGVLANPRDLVRVLNLDQGAERQANGVMISCPFRPERSPSCSVFLGRDETVHVYCFGCGWRGTALDLTAIAHGIDIKKDFRRVLVIAEELGGKVVSRANAPIAPPANVADDAAYDSIWRGVLNRCPLSKAPRVAHYLEQRGIFADAQAIGVGGYPDDPRALINDLLLSFERLDLEETGVLLRWREPRLKHRDLGFFLLIPWYAQNGRLDFVQVRSLDSRKDKYRPCGGRSARSPFGVDLLGEALAFHGPDSEIIIVEGALDCLARRDLDRKSTRLNSSHRL